MVTWIVVGVVLGALLVLALAVRPVLAALGPLGRAATRLADRASQAEALRERAELLEHRLADLQVRAAGVEQGLAQVRARREG